MKKMTDTTAMSLASIQTWRLGLALALLGCAATTMAQTTRYVAASGANGAYTTIAAAITASANGDTIHIIESPHTEYGMTIDKSLTIKGDGADQTIIQGHADRDTAGDRLFKITTASTVAFEDLTLQHGRTPAANNGGALNIAAVAAQTTIQRCHIKDNNAYRNGGGVYATSATGSSLTVLDSTFSGNVTQYTSQGAGGGAIYAGNVDLVVRNCTFFDNLASSLWSYGGAIRPFPAEGQTALIQNSTFVNNRSYKEGSNTGGGAIGTSDTTTLYRDRVLVESCVFQGNQANAANYGSCMYRVSISNTVYHTTASGCIDLGGNTETSDAKVATVLADNGGPTPTLALLEDSPAIDAGSNPASLAYDQRGTGFARTVNDVTDCGAYEFGAEKPAGTIILLR